MRSLIKKSRNKSKNDNDVLSPKDQKQKAKMSGEMFYTAGCSRTFDGFNGKNL